MATTSTKQNDYTRHVTEDTLQSLNLKTENNFHEYVVVIVGINDHHYLLENFPTIISKDCVRSFNDIETSLKFIHDLNDTNIFLIISGTLGKVYAHTYVNEPQVISLYIYCIDESKHALWTKGMEKIRCTVSNTTELLIRLHGDIKQRSGRWAFGQKSFQQASTITSQWYHLFLLVICYQSQYSRDSYNEMFNECRAYYRNNPSMIRNIERFQLTYESDNAISEYTKDSFLYRIVNHALRTQNMETIKKFRPFIRDLHSQLYSYHQKYYLFNEPFIRVVYRGQNLSLNELNYLNSVCKSRNPVVTMTAFGSTSLNPETAMNFASPVTDQIPCLFEIVITDEYNIQQKHTDDHTQVFANISSLSVMPDEQEVLFSLITHFRIKHVEYPVNLSSGSWIFITLELITDKQGECSLNHFNIVKRIRNETNPDIYSDILDMLKMNAEDELKFKNMNWQKWWNNLNYQWGTRLASEQPLHLILYDCFTEDLYWSRKAIDIHKDILRTIPRIKSYQSSFSYLFNTFKSWQKIPTRWIALYEEYLEQFCTNDTEEVFKCLRFAGETYGMIRDKVRALECYQKAFDINANDKYQMKMKIQKQINRLEKLSKTSRTTNNECTVVMKDADRKFSEMYEVRQEEWLMYWSMKDNINSRPSITKRLGRLLRYLELREDWYDASDSKITLCLPYKTTQDLSVSDYRSYFLSAVEKHISSSMTTIDATNNRTLSLWRYKKYMHEWILFKALEKFLQPFQQKSRYISFQILPRLERLLKKLSVLIVSCTVYICIEQISGKIRVNNLQFIDSTQTKMKQLIFFDLHDSDLLADLEALKEEISTIEQISSTITDDMSSIPMEISNFIEKYMQPN
ncbi:unnamed protein product [Rotaria sp. Silwood2]|nr:unnamed protein product [Rotaria sp. Silwood2]CAF4438873.1 unnamed protein product [Rotaria sp. Silwood2]